MNRTNLKLIITALFAAAIAGAAVLLVIGQVGKPARSLTDTDMPQDTVTSFFEALRDSDYSAADEMIYNYELTNTDVQLEDAVAQQLFQALGRSISFEFSGECTVDGLNAVQPVRVTYLDINSAASELNTITKAQVSKRLEEADDPSEFYDGSGEYLEEFVMQVFEEAVVIMLEQADAYYVTKEITIGLVYEDSDWFIELNDELLACMFGGLK